MSSSPSWFIVHIYWYFEPRILLLSSLLFIHLLYEELTQVFLFVTYLYNDNFDSVIYFMDFEGHH